MTLRLRALFAAATVLLALGLPQPASARNYPCPGGSHGIAATPVCAQTGGGGYDDGGGSGGPQGPTSPPIDVNNFIAVAGHPGNRDVWATGG